MTTPKETKLLLVLAADPLPLRWDQQGVIRVGSTRVPLEAVVGAFNQGASAECIVEQYPTLDLGDVYATISYYLRHQAEVDEYVRQQETRADEVVRRLSLVFNQTGIRDRLLARRASQSA